VKARTQDTPDETQNRYQRGDFVLFQRYPTVPRPTKLASPYTGPFEVIQQTKNDVECRHLVMGNIRVLHVTSLKLLTGSREGAYKAALLDADQFVIQSITGEVTRRRGRRCSSSWSSMTVIRCYNGPAAIFQGSKLRCAV